LARRGILLTPSEEELFDKFLSGCFEDGISTRELRISDEELCYFRAKYPASSVQRLPGIEDADGKAWYEVSVRMR
jgi:hypothetical protein